MTRVAAVIGLLCAAAPLYGAEWVRVSTIDINQHWYDRSKVYVDGDLVTYWRRVAFHVPQRTKSGLAASAMYRERVDCRTNMHTTLGYLLYAKDESVLENVRTPDAPAEPIIPGTVGDQFEKLMCSLAPQIALEQKSQSTAMPRTVGELRDEIEFLEARLRLLREQLDLQTRNATPQDAAKPKSSTQPRGEASETKTE
jgi:surface-adhesin protein E